MDEETWLDTHAYSPEKYERMMSCCICFHPTTERDRQMLVQPRALIGGMDQSGRKKKIESAEWEIGDYVNQSHHSFQGRQDVTYWTLIVAWGPIHLRICILSKINLTFLSKLSQEMDDGIPMWGFLKIGNP